MSISLLAPRPACVILSGAKRALRFITLLVIFFTAFTLMGMMGFSVLLALFIGAAYLALTDFNHLFPVLILSTGFVIWVWFVRPPLTI